MLRLFLIKKMAVMLANCLFFNQLAMFCSETLPIHLPSTFKTPLAANFAA
jgi:hypothetical protein